MKLKGFTVHDVKKLRFRARDARNKRGPYDARMRDVYDYIMPYRDVTGMHVSGGRSEGDSRLDKVFDSTALVAAFRFPGRCQREITPIFSDFFALDVGPFLPDDDGRKALVEAFQGIGKQVHAYLQASLFPTAAHEFYSDLYAGTAHMQVIEGDDRQPVICRTIPFAEVDIEEGPYGQIEHWYWTRKWRADEIPVLWDKAELPQSLADTIKNAPQTLVEVCQYTYYDRKNKRYVLVVWCDKSDDKDEPFWMETFRTSPWITARYWKLPGEAYARGPAQLGVPSVKTLNKAQELALKAAAIAIMGVWTYTNDGVFNPDTVRFEPRAMWPVRANGGVLGPSISRLPTPQDFDISSIVIRDQREQTNKALLNDTLPPIADAVRSPTEIVERIAQRNEDLGGVLGRITIEFVVPLVQRFIDILETRGVLKTKITIDQALTMLRVIAPIAAAQQAAKAAGVANWLTMLTQIGGKELAFLAAKIEDLAPELGRWFGVDEKFIRGPEERKKILGMVAQMIAAQQQAAQQQAAPEQNPQAAAVNGGGGL